jgi:hypothetical protein
MMSLSSFSVSFFFFLSVTTHTAICRLILLYVMPCKVKRRRRRTLQKSDDL